MGRNGRFTEWEGDFPERLSRTGRPERMEGGDGRVRAPVTDDEEDRREIEPAREIFVQNRPETLLSKMRDWRFEETRRRIPYRSGVREGFRQREAVRSGPD